MEVSPSTVMALKDCSQARASIVRNSFGSIAASVATKASMVAMSGWIMPAPLAMPVTVTGLSPTRTRRDAALATVSVVMMASAADSQLSSRRSVMHSGSARVTRSTGRGSMITPVENGSTCPPSKPNRRAVSAQMARASASPRSPVPALALPVLTTIARMAEAAARCSRQTRTGAAQKRLRVNTPATVLPSASLNSSRSLRSALRIAARAMPSSTPATGCSSCGSGGMSATGTALRGRRVCPRP